MYCPFEPGTCITLWCDGVDEKENLPPTKKRTEGSSEKPDSSEQTSVNKRDSAEVELR